MKNALITSEQAYLAMFEYLVELFRRANSDELGSLLGGMSYLDDGQTADPAAWMDWLKCVKKVLGDRNDPNLNISVH